ncbi:hypothetical protein SKA57_15860, partial [Enterococcus faecium]
MTTTSFTDLLASPTSADQPELNDNNNNNNNTTSRLSDRIAERTGSCVPKFKSIQPLSLPISPPSPFSPSSFFSIPPGLSLAELLDSPVLLNTSNILPSPTTGAFQSFNWKSNTGGGNQPSVKQEYKNQSDFSFQTQTRPNTTSSIGQQNQPWNYQ